MSIHLSSDDVSSGYIYDGVWDFLSSFKGYYTLKQQSIEVGDIPWVYPGCNELYIEQFIGGGGPTTITFPTMTDDNSTSVRNWFTTAINSSGWVTVTSSSYDATLNQYTFNFSTSLLIAYAKENSSIAYVFNWVFRDPLSDIPTSTLIIDGRYITNSPKYLEIHSTDIQNGLLSTIGDTPAILISTQDSFILNQSVKFNGIINSLNLKIYRPNNDSAVCPITNKYDLVFFPF